MRFSVGGTIINGSPRLQIERPGLALLWASSFSLGLARLFETKPESHTLKRKPNGFRRSLVRRLLDKETLERFMESRGC